MKKTIPCSSCNRRNTIAKTTLIQTHWYVEPYSCTGGDYWKAGEVNFICARCGCRNRLLFGQTYDYSLQRYVSAKEDLFDARYRRCFKEIVDEYDDTKVYPCVNNWWIDTLTEKER